MFMGGFFFVFGILKILKLKDFAIAYKEYDILAMRSNAYAHAYPFIELGLGVLYFTNLIPLATNIATVIIMSIGAIGVYRKLRNKEEIPCACLGTVFKVPMTWVTLVEDLLMVFMALVMISIFANFGSFEDSRPTFTADELFAQAFTGDAGNVAEYTLVADEQESTIELPDGNILTLDTWLYNNELAGNILSVKLGDRIKVKFENNLSEPSTIHWHGVRLPQNMDGVPEISQDPVQPGESFVYEFTPKDAGTFWFHPHVNGSEQLERGLYGVLIVEPTEKTYDEDIVMMIDDWRLDRAGNLDENFVTPHDLMHDGRWGQLVTVNGKVEPNYTLTPGTRVRLRLINTANGRVFKPVSETPWKVVAMDDMNVPESQLLSELQPVLSPEDRIDLELDVTEAYQNISIVDEYISGYPNTLTTFSLVEPLESDSGLHSSAPVALPNWSFLNDEEPDYEYKFNAKGMHMSLDWVINGEIYDKEVKETWKEGELIKIRFTNESVRLHPMHLHGQFFQVLARNGVSENVPSWQDTILVNPNETVDIALAPTEVGVWPLQCHIQEHADAGMMRLNEVVPN